MHKSLTLLALIAGLILCRSAQAQAEKKEPEKKEPAKSAPTPIPKEVENFSGMLIGRLQARDLERGEFTVTIDYVPRIWEGNKAQNPRVLVGKTIVVEGVTGKFLDNLLLIRPGETVEFEAQHRGGDRLRFPGEWLRKAPPFDAKNYPSPPDAFRGFAGVIVGKIDSKIDESGEIVVRVSDIEKADANSKAEKAESALGKQILVAGFWGKRRKPFDELTVGDKIRAGLVHRVSQSDHFSVTDLIEKVDAKPNE